MTAQDIPSNLPNNHILAVFDGDDSASRAAADLKRHGFSDTLVLGGDSLEQAVDAKGDHSNPISKAVKAVQDHFSEEPNYLAQYQEEARHGNRIIAVEAKDRSRTDEVRDILNQYGGRNIRLFGALAVADLSPGSNPSARSAESPEPQSNT